MLLFFELSSGNSGNSAVPMIIHVIA